MDEYGLGMACLNGHKVDGDVLSSPEFSESRCSKCGEPTITKCQSCGEAIRGYYKGVLSVDWELAAYCPKCGKPFPWTQRRAEALGEMLVELEGLSPEERERLKESMPDILADTPKSETAALRFKKAVAKVGQVGGKVLMDVLAKVGTEAVRKSMGL